MAGTEKWSSKGKVDFVRDLRYVRCRLDGVGREGALVGIGGTIVFWCVSAVEL